MTGLVSKLSNSQRNTSAERSRVQDNTQAKSQSCAESQEWECLSSLSTWDLLVRTCFFHMWSECHLEHTGQEGLVNLWNTKSEIPAFNKIYFQVVTGFFFFSFGRNQALGEAYYHYCQRSLHTQGAQLTPKVMVLHMAENRIKKKKYPAATQSLSMAEGKTASSSGMEMFWIPGYLVSPEPGEEEHRWVLCPFSCHKSSSSRTAAWAQPWGWGRACPLLPHIKWDSKKMTNQSIWVGNSPRLCLLLQTFHTVTLQSDWGLCLLYTGKGTFILELAQGIVWKRRSLHTYFQ